MAAISVGVLDRVIALIEEGEGRVGLVHYDGEWTVAVEWGREAEDSPMIGAAAYGVGETLEEALAQACEEAGLEFEDISGAGGDPR